MVMADVDRLRLRAALDEEIDELEETFDTWFGIWQLNLGDHSDYCNHPEPVKEARPPKRAHVADTEALATPMRHFQQDEVKRLRGLTRVLRQVHRDVLDVYKGLTAESTDEEIRLALEPVFEAYEREFLSFLEEAIFDTRQQAIDDTVAVLKMRGIDLQVYEQASVPTVDVVFGPGRVAGSYAGARGTGAVGPMLSRRIWDSGQVGATQIGPTMRDSLREGVTAKQFGRNMEPYLLPGREFPRAVPSSVVSQQPRSLAYNAFRLGRTEINQAYNHTRKTLDTHLKNKGVLVGSRWVLSGEHAFRMSRLGKDRDECDEYAEHYDGQFSWLSKYGVDPAGVWESGDIPIAHPNCLCTLVPVPTPTPLLQKALSGDMGPVSPEGYPPPPEFLTGIGDEITRQNSEIALRWMQQYYQNKGYKNHWNGRLTYDPGRPGWNAVARWDGSIGYSDHVSNELRLLFQGASGEGPWAGSQSWVTNSFRTLLHEQTHMVNPTHNPGSYARKYQKVFEEGITEAYTRSIADDLARAMFPGKEWTPARGAGAYDYSVSLAGDMAQAAGAVDEVSKIAKINEWKKTTSDVKAWNTACKDIAKNLRDKGAKGLKSTKVKKTLEDIIGTGGWNTDGVLSSGAWRDANYALRDMAAGGPY